jgi:hypothetical protein
MDAVSARYSNALLAVAGPGPGSKKGAEPGILDLNRQPSEVAPVAPAAAGEPASKPPAAFYAEEAEVAAADVAAELLEALLHAPTTGVAVLRAASAVLRRVVDGPTPGSRCAFRPRQLETLREPTLKD